MTFRVLVTGSRDWDDIAAIENELKEFKDEPGALLISGSCPTGADRMAEKVWESWGLPVERHPADWATHGRRAGFVRNAEMVNAGADACVAFIKNDSKGATMTRDIALRAGISPVTTVIR